MHIEWPVHTTSGKVNWCQIWLGNTQRVRFSQLALCIMRSSADIFTHSILENYLAATLRPRYNVVAVYLTISISFTEKANMLLSGRLWNLFLYIELILLFFRFATSRFWKHCLAKWVLVNVIKMICYGSGMYQVYRGLFVFTSTQHGSIFMLLSSGYWNYVWQHCLVELNK